jgi:hypothetical protein
MNEKVEKIEKVIVNSKSGNVTIHTAGVSEDSVVPAAAPTVTGVESITATGAVTHPKVVGTTNGVKFSNPA